MKDIVYFDMDNVLCDFGKAYRKKLQEEPGIFYPQSQYGFFVGLEPVEGAIEAYKKLKEKYTVRILSTPSVLNPLSFTEKRIWIEKYLGLEECSNLTLSCDKTLCRGKYLIDDCKQEGLLIPDWELIHFKTELFPDFKAVLDYLI